MFKTLFIRELQDYLYSLRFQISFAITLLVFIVGTVSYVASVNEVNDSYNELVQNEHKQLEARAANATNVAIKMSVYILPPENSAIIDNCKGDVMPNRFIYSAYNVFSFDAHHNSSNPLMKKMQGLNWAFIVSVILSFMTLLLAFDAICGEKEAHTLSLIFSNQVSRLSFVLSKFLGIVTIVMSVTVIGIIVSMVIILLSGKVLLNSQFFSETASFLLISLLFISTMAVIGLAASTLSKQSNISLLICLFMWIFFTVILPNSSVFFANKLFGISSPDKVAQIVKQERDDIFKSTPGSWSFNGGNPFYEVHEPRAANTMKMMNSRKKHYDAYYNDMFRQFERTRMISFISPVAQFEYMNEAVLGSGYLRFQKNWNDLHIFQEQFLAWFKNLDAKDEKSPHWYNPHEEVSTTKQAVLVNDIPVYTERHTPFIERILFMRNYLFAAIATIGICFLVCFIRFLRYDVR